MNEYFQSLMPSFAYQLVSSISALQATGVSAAKLYALVRDNMLGKYNLRLLSGTGQLYKTVTLHDHTQYSAGGGRSQQ